MPKDKNFKRLVRERMEKTGERFAAARAQLETQRQRRNDESAEPSAREKAVRELRRQVEHLRDAADQARAAGMSLPEISGVLRVEPGFLRKWLLADSLDDERP